MGQRRTVIVLERLGRLGPAVSYPWRVSASTAEKARLAKDVNLFNIQLNEKNLLNNCHYQFYSIRKLPDQNGVFGQVFNW